jgi:hypothetical protein
VGQHPAQQFSLGELIAAWGDPSGIISSESVIHVYWGTRSALLYTRSLQPNSPVDFILYDPAFQQTSRWLGFTSVRP